MVAELLVRWAHVLGMAVLFGGAVLTWALFRGGVPRRAAATYEWLFWAGIGLVVATGVGNLGSLAPTIPGPGSRWGLALSLKLVAVIGLVLGSAVRTLAVVQWQTADHPTPAAARRLGEAYAATAVYLLLVVAVAEVLAHG